MCLFNYSEMATNQESADENFARELQRQFDEEEKAQEESVKLALSMSKDHELSDSDSDVTLEPDSPNSPDLFDKSTKGVPRSTTLSKGVSPNDISESDTTDQNELSVSLKSNRSLHEISDSDSDEQNSKTSSKDASVKSVKRKSDHIETIYTNNPKRQKCSPSRKQSASESEDSDTTLPAPEDENDTKPLCKYGSKCYRKNPSHLSEFRHTDIAKSSTSSERVSVTKKNVTEIYREAQPLSLFLSKVSDIPLQYNNAFAVHIKDILSPRMGKLVASAQFNYMFDIPWLVQQYPEEFRSKPMLLIHGEDRQAKAALHAEADPFPNIRLCQAKLEIMYGTHHTKMMFLLYEDGLRIVIHTCNLVERDWYQKTQGVWISPVFPKLERPPSEGAVGADSLTHFKQDLLSYLAAYKTHVLADWVKHIRHHDMTSAKVYLIGSVPGRHIGEKKEAWGHLRLRKVLRQTVDGDVKKWPVIGQFSSIGSLGGDKTNWLCAEWLQSLSSNCQSGMMSQPPLQLIFPSKDNVRLSLEGYPGGGCVPYSVNVAKKQTYLHSFFHQWKSDGRGRSRAVPHIKTYLRASPDYKRAAWFLVTSANLSKAAWGALEKKGSQLMIRSYELGVLFLPKHFTDGNTFDISSSLSTLERPRKSIILPLPYDLPPTPYNKTERPWMWDVPYTDLPDTNGNIWCPPSHR